MITSLQNPLAKRIRRLQQKKHRLAEGAFFVEGIRVVASAVEYEADIEQLIYCSALLSSEFGRTLLENTPYPKIEVSEELFRSLSERDTPSGLGALIKTRPMALTQLPFDKKGVYVALFDISDPGNLGTIIRTVDGAGANGVILVGSTTDPYHATCLKASMGAIFKIPIVSAEWDEIQKWIDAHGVHTMATSAHAPLSYTQTNYTKPLLFYMGSEREGLAQKVIDSAESTVYIPMRGCSTSLNLAVATGILLYEATR